MTDNKLQPRQALNKAFLKVKPKREDIEKFKGNLTILLEGIKNNKKESEEFHKTLVGDFLKNTYYSPAYSINTKKHNDLVIHNGKDAQSDVGIILEVKKPANKNEMPHLEGINTKALQQLLLYFLRERITEKNLQIKYLIVTNINQWFIFDASIFEKLFIEDKEFINKFIDFNEGRMYSKNTDFFYKEIAKPKIDLIKETIEFTYFDIQEYEQYLNSPEKEDELIVLFKILSPEHLLKLPFANDSNCLDKGFYSELLHIIGLEETKKGPQRLIERKEQDRHDGSLIENAINQLEDKINNIKDRQIGNTKEERLFNAALELVITWINRILFLKLLESQLIKYHKGDQSFAFLNLHKIKNFYDINSLFFKVLARKIEERNHSEQATFPNIPYLNSSLFEPTDIEKLTIFISNLKNEKLPIFSSTILKDSHGKQRKGELNTLEYLFEFLSAYDFSSEGSETIQEDNKRLINASVLGLIFEKINGYKEGSFYTPGFITMYMCRETIRRAVLDKFNQQKTWNCQNINELHDNIKDKQEANDIINSLKICDPAVGSGHFLVSALNEIIALKSELKILCYPDGKTLRDYNLEVINDELITTDDNGRLFEYNPNNRESQRVQETIFHEKQTIIEKCLFGVDINRNSVKICRLRLWIELLKNAYYKSISKETQLETLPNIDINIKCGNSLISHFSLDIDLQQAFKQSRRDVKRYRDAVQTYRHAENKEQKQNMERLIDNIKGDLRTEISNVDPKAKELRNLKQNLDLSINQMRLLPESDKEKKDRLKKENKLQHEIDKLTAEIEQIKSNKIYENAFEWRFEFPEVLNDHGDFVGFDVIIGNPPYIRQEEIKELKPILQAEYECYTGVADIYVYFYERGVKLLQPQGHLSYITSNKYFRAGYGEKLRKFLANNSQVHTLIDFGDAPVFEATAYPSMVLLTKSNQDNDKVNVLKWDSENSLDKFASIYKNQSFSMPQKALTSDGWRLESPTVLNLLDKLRTVGTPLGEYINGKFYRGILTGLNEAFVVDKVTRDRLITEHELSAEILKPLLRGRDVKRWRVDYQDLWLIFTRRGIDINKYPAIYNYLLVYKKKLMPGGEGGRKPGSYQWYEIQDNIAYWQEFAKPKIVWGNLSTKTNFAFADRGTYINAPANLIIYYSKYLLGILNSYVTQYLMSQISAARQGGFYEFKPMYISQLSIPTPSQTERAQLETLVQNCLDTKGQGVKEWEAEIDDIVAHLYRLTDEEKKIIRGD